MLNTLLLLASVSGFAQTSQVAPIAEFEEGLRDSYQAAGDSVTWSKARFFSILTSVDESDYDIVGTLLSKPEDRPEFKLHGYRFRLPRQDSKRTTYDIQASLEIAGGNVATELHCFYISSQKVFCSGSKIQGFKPKDELWNYTLSFELPALPALKSSRFTAEDSPF